MRFYKKNILIIGLGLMGASLGQALMRRRQSREDFNVWGYARKEATINVALQQGIIDKGGQDLRALAQQADIIFICVPMLAFENTLQQLSGCMKADAIISDVGSVKNEVIRACQQVYGKLPENFIPGHPIAGAEKSGVHAANADLYECHQVILTPLPHSSVVAEKMITDVWQFVGAQVVSMTVEHHDDVLAATSHLPHLLAFSLVNTLNHRSENREIFHYAAGGFRDFTRIAASDTTMWHDIFNCNKDSLLNVLDAFTEDLENLKLAIASDDELGVKQVLSQAKTAREYFTEVLANRKKMSNDVG